MPRKRRKPDEIVAKLRQAAGCPSPCSRYGPRRLSSLWVLSAANREARRTGRSYPRSPRAAIADAERGGRDVARSRELLSLLEESQRLHVAGRERLRKYLDDAHRP
jgi:hypothetical protein